MQFTDYNVGEEALFVLFDGNLTPFGGIPIELDTDTRLPESDLKAFQKNTYYGLIGSL